jgi:predicted HTH transcriptional regulator
VLNTFPLIKQSIKDETMNAYRHFAGGSEDLQILELIDKGETDKVEFKVAACWNAERNRKDDDMKKNIFQAVAAFLNSKEGGTILIGVANNKTIVGLEEDYKVANPQKRDKDGYSLFLSDIINHNILGNCILYYSISFNNINGRDICRIKVSPATEPVYLKDGAFYVRENNRKRALNPFEAQEYCKRRW